MLRFRFIATLLLATSGLALSQDGGAQDTAVPVDLEAVAKLLDERCASCHAPGAEDPKALKKWDGALDLAATAADAQLIVPGDTEESELYSLIEFEEMPPEDSDIPMLNEAEKAVIAAWIMDGAKVPAPDAPTTEEAAEAQEPPKKEPMNPVLKWLSHFHPIVVHFPIGLLSAAFLAQLLFALRPSWKTDIAAGFCLAVGALGSIPSALLGWQLAESRASGGDELFNHRWLGVATAVSAMLIWRAYYRWPKKRFWLLLVLAVLVGFAGHTGGILSYGANWLKPPF
ncbi:MAG: putative membrane protein/mono/diheme cytochrome c family protein [Planctomycetota bacterium]|jgi:uncharacterized membrane protein/mono/diheme cytochrome c family protein